MAATFEFPWQFSFPPFFTLQPNAETRARQLATWGELLLAYARAHRLQQLDVVELAQMKPPCGNPAIARSLSPEGIRAVLDHLATSGHVEWIPDTDNKQCLIMWRSPQQWGEIIYNWARKTGNIDSVCTLYELREGDTGEGTEFHGMDARLFSKALSALQAQGRAEVFQLAGEPDEMSDSVKFFVAN